MRSILLLLLALPAHAQWGNTFAPIPFKVMGEGKLSNSLSLGTVVSTANVSNMFKGYWTNGSWTVKTNNGTAQPIVGTSLTVERQQGFFVPTVTAIDDDTADRNWIQTCTGSDIYAEWNPFTGFDPIVVVLGFELTISNWTAASTQIYDIIGIGDDPFNILNLGDGSEISNVQTLNTHTGDTGLSPLVRIVNNQCYQVVMLFDGLNTNSGARATVYEKLPAGMKFKGEVGMGMSTNNVAGGNLAHVIKLGMFDDHTATAGGVLRYKNFWMTTNRADYTSQFFPYY